MNRNRNIAIGCGVVALFMFMMFAMVAVLQMQFQHGDVKLPTGKLFKKVKTPSSGKIGLLYVAGVIHTGRSSRGFMGDQTSGSDTLVSMIEKAGEDPSIRAIVIRVNSPGGSPAGSQEIYRAIMRVRDEYGKPVIISMGDVAASGGYYISAAGDTIFADPATLTGSIGVIMGLLNYSGLMKKVGLESVTLKSVEFKDIGSPYRQMKPEEKAILQSAIDDLHQQFVTDVAAGRKMKLEDVLKIADGRVFTGEQAKRFKLVDRMGGLREALDFAAKKAGLEAPADIENLQKENPFSMLFESLSRLEPGALNKLPMESIADSLFVNPVLNPR